MKFLCKSESCISPLGYSVAGAFLLFLAMPGSFGWWPLLFVALVPLYLSTLRTTPRRAFFSGFIFGFFYHTFLLYWIVIVLAKYGGLSFWLAVGGLLLLSAYMSLYTALFCWMYNRLASSRRRRGISSFSLICSAPVLWIAIEYVRGIAFTGFPWLDLGYGLHSQPYLIQAADLGGHLLISMMIVSCNSLITWIILRFQNKVILSRTDIVSITIGCSFLLVLFGYSIVRYQLLDGRIKQSFHVQVAAVQGNIDQSVKWSPENKLATVKQYISLSQLAGQGEKASLIVWPETALPFYPQQDPATAHLFEYVRTEKQWLLTGAPLIAYSKTADTAAAPQYLNGALLFSSQGGISGMYAKSHLVPFGEYVPARRFLPFINPLVENVGDFTPGSSKAPLIMDTLKLGVLICYESIFPGIARDSVALGANLLVNITNDAWYGRSSAPYQSMAMAVFRAVENKRSLVRAANTGISGFVDPLGRVIQQTPIFTATAIKGSIPVLEEKTLFCAKGHWLGLFSLALVPLFFIVRRRVAL